MNAFRQWFQSLTTGQKIVIAIGIWLYIVVISGFAILGFAWSRPIVVIPIVIAIMCLISDIRRLMH